MQITKSIRRTAATVILTAGLAYPACAAVCPKGHSGCPSPGRCFLFVDADGNSLCDYTSGTSSQAASGYPTQPGASSQASTQVQETVTQVPDSAATAMATQSTQAAPVQDTASSALTATASGGSFDPFSLSSLITEAALFLMFTGIIFCLVRRGIAGIREERPLPALALASLFGLGLSLIAGCILIGSASTGTTYALVYMAAGSLLAAYLWYADVMNRRIVLGLAGLGTLAGFVLLAPIMPQEIGGVVNVISGASSPTFGVLVICTVIALAAVVGRTFCGNICPVGSLQELAYAVPARKITIRQTHALEIIRLVVFVVTVFAAVFLIDLMAYTGLYDLFSLALTAGSLVALCLILLSVFVYRPVCRVLCPFGLLFSLTAEFSIFRLKRTGACRNCKKCEIACPARTAGKDDPKRECYLCGRCTGACPAEGALSYRH